MIPLHNSDYKLNQSHIIIHLLFGFFFFCFCSNDMDQTQGLKTCKAYVSQQI